MNEDQMIFLTSQKDASISDPAMDDIYNVGVVCKIIQVLKQPDDITRVVVEGQYRAKIVSQVECESYIEAMISPIKEKKRQVNTARELALVRLLRETYGLPISIWVILPGRVVRKWRL